MHIKQIKLLICILSFSFSANASEFFRLVADLDGDDKPETLTASISGDEDFKKYSINIGPATYSGKFYAAQGDLPQITRARIHYSKKSWLIVVKITSPDFIDFKILSYSEGNIKELLHHMTKDGDEPQIGRDKVKTENHFGFWARKNQYTLNNNRTKLILSNTIYPVQVTGEAANKLSLKQANCKGTTIPKGNPVIVDKYDSENKQYLIKSKDLNACGWVNEREIIDTVSNLPWSG